MKVTSNIEGVLICCMNNFDETELANLLNESGSNYLMKNPNATMEEIDHNILPNLMSNPTMCIPHIVKYFKTHYDCYATVVEEGENVHVMNFGHHPSQQLPIFNAVIEIDKDYPEPGLL